MPDRIRLLLLTPFAPRLDASHGGARVIAQLAARLALRHDIVLLALRADEDAPTDPVLRQRCVAVEERIRPGFPRTLGERWGRRRRLAAGLLAGEPMWVCDCRVPEYARRVGEVAESWRPDVVQLEYHVMGQYATALPDRPPRVLVQHEPGEPAAAALADAATGPERALRKLDRLAWARYERGLLRQVDAAVVFTERDRAYAARPGLRVAVIPPGAELPTQAYDGLGSDPPSVLFVGSFIHPPNVDAARRLVERIFPLVRRSRPDARLVIVGESPPPELSSSEAAGVVVTGRVPDVGPYLDRAAVVVAPLRLGGGMRVKVLEALAGGKAVVASRLALAGLAVRPGEHVLVGDGDDEIAAAVVELLDSPARRAQLAAAAREWALVHLDWNRAVEAYERLYASLASARSGD